ncbi:uncharacterized protein LOC141496488 [Macrotis lagotis]|uniref:uncharacterized protein LOC141496488 n=1 Tax=Macrotis lagotis TaxID=92651 RepID=UPI003D694905
MSTNAWGLSMFYVTGKIMEDATGSFWLSRDTDTCAIQQRSKNLWDFWRGEGDESESIGREEHVGTVLLNPLVCFLLVPHVFVFVLSRQRFQRENEPLQIDCSISHAEDMVFSRQMGLSGLPKATQLEASYLGAYFWMEESCSSCTKLFEYKKRCKLKVDLRYRKAWVQVWVLTYTGFMKLALIWHDLNTLYCRKQLSGSVDIEQDLES